MKNQTGEVISFATGKPVEPAQVEGGPEAVAKMVSAKHIKIWVAFTMKAFGAAWTEQALLSELSFVRARKLFEKK